LIFIFGIDALDYDLVEKWDLKNLKQLEYNKISVPINKKIGLPLSAEVWASFLTGKYISINLKSSSYIKNIILDVLYYFNIDLLDGFGKKVKNILKKLGFSSPARFKDLNHKTFLDLNNSKEINAIYYSFDHSTINALFHYNNGKITFKKLIEEIDLIYENRKIQILNELDNVENVDIIFVYMHAIDILQHLLYNHIKKIKKYYIDIDNYVSLLKNIIDIKFTHSNFIIVSDHGFDFELGNHSIYGYYSSNLNLIPKPSEITDFYKLIINSMNNESR